MQIFGGHGFIRETGVEQYVRDSRITLIYEGTTQIQALDLLGRKVMMTQGKALLVFVEEMQRVVEGMRGHVAGHRHRARTHRQRMGDVEHGDRRSRARRI